MSSLAPAQQVRSPVFFGKLSGGLTRLEAVRGEGNLASLKALVDGVAFRGPPLPSSPRREEEEGKSNGNISACLVRCLCFLTLSISSPSTPLGGSAWPRLSVRSRYRPASGGGARWRLGRFETFQSCLPYDTDCHNSSLPPAQMFPLAPATRGKVRQRLKLVGEIYDRAGVVHPSCFGCVFPEASKATREVGGMRWSLLGAKPSGKRFAGQCLHLDSIGRGGLRAKDAATHVDFRSDLENRPQNPADGPDNF